MNEASRYLRDLARGVAAAYIAHTGPQAILLAGSAATGDSDCYSDVDLIAYYDALPSDEAAQQACRATGGTGARPLGPREAGGFAEQYAVRGVQVQVAHHTAAAWEDDLAKVLDAYDPDPLLQKAIGGLLEGLPLHGDDLIRRWQVRAAAYPDGLARAMVTRHLRFFPVWLVWERLAARDATVWLYQTLAESAQNVIGVLAGLNGRYYSTFQFKRMRAFVATLETTPPNLATRLERLFHADPAAAVADLEALVAETVPLVEARLPGVDTAPVRKYLGARERPWQPPPDR